MSLHVDASRSAFSRRRGPSQTQAELPHRLATGLGRLRHATAAPAVRCWDTGGGAGEAALATHAPDRLACLTGAGDVTDDGQGIVPADPAASAFLFDMWHRPGPVQPAQGHGRQFRAPPTDEAAV